MNDTNTQIRKSITQLKKLFNYCPEEPEKIPIDKRVGYMDKSNCIMLIPKNYFMKNLITNDFDVEESKVVDLKYDKGGSCKFSTEFLSLLLPMLKNTVGASFKISVQKEYPMTIETNEMIVIIAPRVDV